MTKFARRRSSSKRESLDIIPELPAIEDHYTEYDSFADASSPTALTPRRRNTATICSRSIQRQQRRATVLQAIDNALKILELDESTNSHCTMLTAPLTDEEPSTPLTDEETSDHTSGSIPLSDSSSELTAPNSPLLRGNRRWNADIENSPKSPNTPTSSNSDKKKRKPRRKKKKTSTPDSAPVCPVRQRQPEVLLGPPPLA